MSAKPIFILAGVITGMIVSSAIALAQIDNSCVGVQVMSIAAKVRGLGADGSQYGDVIKRVEGWQAESQKSVNDAEERWKAAQKQEGQRLVSQNPGASRQELERLWARTVRESAELDNARAALLVAQLNAHKVEEKIIKESQKVPAQDTPERVAQLSREALKSMPVPADIAAGVETSQTFRHLVATLAAAKMGASSSSEIPAAPLARIGFDTAPPDAQIVRATESAAALISDADARAQRARLITGHIERMLGKPEERAALLADKSKETTQEIHREVAGALVELQRSRAVMEHLARVPIDQISVPSPETPGATRAEAWSKKLAAKVEQAVEDVTEVVYGLPPGQGVKR
jgi:hypothetical protein